MTVNWMRLVLDTEQLRLHKVMWNIFDRDSGHTGGRRPLLEQGAEALDGVRRGEPHHLYRTLLGVRHPPADPQRLGVAQREPPESHALDAPGEHPAPADEALTLTHRGSSARAAGATRGSLPPRAA